MDEFLDKVFAPIENTQVDTLFWCVGEHQAKWESKILPVVGEHTGRIYEHAHAYNFNENILAMIERGEDPHKEMIKRARELGLRIFASVRMNDNHFGGAGIDQLKTLHHSELTKFRIANPELLLGAQPSEWGWRQYPCWFAKAAPSLLLLPAPPSCLLLLLLLFPPFFLFKSERCT